MSPHARLIGEQIAKSAKARAEAFEIINARTDRPLWGYITLCVVVFSLGTTWLREHTGSDGMFVVGAIAELSSILAIVAYAECSRPRKQLNAVMVLLNEDVRR